jgi:hypothetical protein
MARPSAKRVRGEFLQILHMPQDYNVVVGYKGRSGSVCMVYIDKSESQLASGF